MPTMTRKYSCPGSEIVEGHCAVCGAGVEWGMDEGTEHKTRVDQYLTGAERHRSGQYQVVCSNCGNVGHPQDYRNDADEIAQRHAEIGGFEHP